MNEENQPHRPQNEMAVHFDDDPDPKKAGQGLAVAPLIREILGLAQVNYWEMSPAEQMAMIYLLEHLRPKVAIEIGTRFGGSLQVIAKYCERVYSLDIDPDVPVRLAGVHSNVEYITGPSSETLPRLLNRLAAENAALGFVLVDGDHSALGVKTDLDHILNYQPVTPLYVIMHDSFNPECRRGLREAAWKQCAFVHAVELDFVAGVVNPSPAFRDQMWGGLALGILQPKPRGGRFEITGRSSRTFECLEQSERFRKLSGRFSRFLRRIGWGTAGRQ